MPTDWSDEQRAMWAEERALEGVEEDRGEAGDEGAVAAGEGWQQEVQRQADLIREETQREDAFNALGEPTKDDLEIAFGEHKVRCAADRARFERQVEERVEAELAEFREFTVEVEMADGSVESWRAFGSVGASNGVIAFNALGEPMIGRGEVKDATADALVSAVMIPVERVRTLTATDGCTLRDHIRRQAREELTHEAKEQVGLPGGTNALRFLQERGL